jgi:hypothetical protein
MSILSKHVAFVNEQAEFHEKTLRKFAPDSFRAKLHQSTAEKFRSLAIDLESSDKLLDAPVSVPEVRVTKTPLQLSLGIEELEGLPPDLIQELSLSDGDKTEFAIVNSIEEAGGVISLDRLLIALWKKTGEIHKRVNLTSRMARMASKNSIYYVPGKKGTYSTEQLSSEEVAKLFGVTKPVPDVSDLL